jgi:hypothetical protein
MRAKELRALVTLNLGGAGAGRDGEERARGRRTTERVRGGAREHAPTP